MQRWVLGALALVLLSYGWSFTTLTAPNERSRVYLSVAMVDHHTVRIEAPLARFGPVTDMATFEGRAYSDKAPGASLLGAVVYGAVRLFSRAEAWDVGALIVLFRRVVMLPVSLLGFFLMRRTLYLLKTPDGLVDPLALGWLLGSSAFHYGAAFYGHQIVAVALLGAFLLLHRAERRDGRTSLIGAGALAGLAGLTEYQAGVPCALLVAYAISRPALRAHGRWLWILAGAAPFAIALAAYNTVAFGGPLELSYSHVVMSPFQRIHHEGVAGVTRFQPRYLMGILLSRHRGLVGTSPVFLLLPLGLALGLRGGRRAVAALFGLSMMGYVVFVSSTPMWFGGWGFGPRLLVPVMAWGMALVAIGAGWLCRGERWWGHALVRGLLLAGLLYHQVVHAFLPELPAFIRAPLPDVVWPMLQAGQVGPNMAWQLFGWSGPWSLLPQLVLVLVAAWWIVVRGLGEGSRGRRGATIAGACAVAAVFLALTAGIPSTTKASKSEGLRVRITDWHHAERDGEPEAVRASPALSEPSR